MNRCGWKGSFKEFLLMDTYELTNILCLHIYHQTMEEAKIDPSEESTISQIKAWIDCIQFLKREFVGADEWPGFLLFEFEILRSGGRRPDVLLLLPGEVTVLEFKSYNRVKEAEYTQTSLYVRDLEHYHSAIQQKQLKVRGALVLTRSNRKNPTEEIDLYQIYQLGPSGVRGLTERLNRIRRGEKVITPEEFLRGTYQPLPTIIESARAIMRDEPLPQIKSLRSSNFESVIKEVGVIVQFAKEKGTHHLVLVSGVPGAGKTFVGLTLAHDLEKAIYLSGNGPLVEVLQDSLQSETFVQALYNYKRDYLQNGKVPEENIIIFDEAQRA